MRQKAGSRIKSGMTKENEATFADHSKAGLQPQVDRAANTDFSAPFPAG